MTLWALEWVKQMLMSRASQQRALPLVGALPAFYPSGSPSWFLLGFQGILFYSVDAAVRGLNRTSETVRPVRVCECVCVFSFNVFQSNFLTFTELQKKSTQK